MAEITSRTVKKNALGHLLPGGTLENCTIQSDILGTEKKFTVYLPDDYDTSDRSYPVMYLFHPAGGTNTVWAELGQIRQILDDAHHSRMIVPMIVVMPDASGEGDYNMGRHLGYFSVEGYDYESYFHRELIPAIDKTYRTIADKAHRAVVGPSMGGEAAVAYAQKYPDYYCAVGSISGILGKPEQSRMAATDKAYAQSLIDNNPAKFVQEATDVQLEALRTIRWYADCGDSDFFYEGNIEFFLAMRRRGVPMDYRMRSGTHSWYYWITGLPAILQFVSAAFGGGR